MPPHPFRRRIPLLPLLTFAAASPAPSQEDNPPDALVAGTASVYASTGNRIVELYQPAFAFPWEGATGGIRPVLVGLRLQRRLAAPNARGRAFADDGPYAAGGAFYLWFDSRNGNQAGYLTALLKALGDGAPIDAYYTTGSQPADEQRRSLSPFAESNCRLEGMTLLAPAAISAEPPRRYDRRIQASLDLYRSQDNRILEIHWPMGERGSERLFGLRVRRRLDGANARGRAWTQSASAYSDTSAYFLWLQPDRNDPGRLLADLAEAMARALPVDLYYQPGPTGSDGNRKAIPYFAESNCRMAGLTLKRRDGE